MRPLGRFLVVFGKVKKGVFNVLSCVLFSGVLKSKGYVELGIDINISLHLSQRLTTISSPSQEIALVFSSIEAGQSL